MNEEIEMLKAKVEMLEAKVDWSIEGVKTLADAINKKKGSVILGDEPPPEPTKP